MEAMLICIMVQLTVIIIILGEIEEKLTKP